MKELGRLLNKKTITIMIAAACICVAAIFARDSSDCGISNYGVKAREYTWIAAGHSEEEIQQHTDELSQDNRRIFKRLAKEYAEKTAYIEGYADSIKAVITSASNMKKFSIFGTTDSMSNINKTEKDYKRIENVDVTMMNSRAAEQFLKYDISIYIVLALMIYVIYSIYEYRDNGMWQITYTAVNGRMRLAAKGVIGIGVITMASAFIMQICGLAAMLCVYGGWNTLTAPVQCLTGYNNYTLPVNVITYLFIRYVVMCVIVFTLSLVISLVSALCRKRIGAMVLVGIIAGAEAFAYQNISMQSSLRVFRKINIINVMNVSSILKKYDNVTIAGASVSVTNVLCIVCVIISIVAAILLILLGKLVRPGRGIGLIGKIIEKIGQLNQVVLFRLPHFWKETYKVLITARGWIVVCVVLFMTVFICNNQKITYSDDEQKKDEYYQQYGGSDYSGFTAIIEQRRKDVQEAESRLETAQEQYDRGEIDENTVSRYVYNLMDAQRILDSMSEYIQQIEYVKQVKEEYGIDAYVMSQRGYDQILGDKGAARRLLIYVVLGFGVVLIAEAENSVEYKNSMNMLINSSEKGRRWERTVKACAVCVLAGVSAFLLYIIEMWIMYKAYGMPYINAPLISLSFMNPGRIFRGITIRQYMCVLMAREIIYAVTAALETMFVSRHILKKNSNKGAATIIALNTIILFIIM